MIQTTLHRLLSRFALVLALTAGATLVAPDVAFADGDRPGVASCKKKKKKQTRRRRVRRNRRAKRARRAKAVRVNAKIIKRWQRKGLSDAAIVEKATASGYVANKREQRKLKRMRVRPTLLAALVSGEVAAPVAARPAAPEPIDLNKTIDPNEIDFDSVPPPTGMPAQYAKTEPSKDKKLNTSLRPSAPFVPKAGAKTEEKKPRRVIVSSAK